MSRRRLKASAPGYIFGLLKQCVTRICPHPKPTFCISCAPPVDIRPATSPRDSGFASPPSERIRVHAPWPLLLKYFLHLISRAHSCATHFLSCTKNTELTAWHFA